MAELERTDNQLRKKKTKQWYANMANAIENERHSTMTI